MFRLLLLLLAVAGLHARPLHRFPNGRLKQTGPQMVQDEHRDNSVLKDNGVKLKKQIPVPAEFCRQGTEPSRRFLMDLNTGMLKEEVGEMNRRVSGFYSPPAAEMRKGTQNSQAILVDPRTGQMLPSLNELQRNTVPLDEFRQGTEHQLHILEELRMHHMIKPQYSPQSERHEQRAIPAEVYRQGTEPSRNILMDLNTGLLKEHRNEVDRRVVGSAKWEVVSGPEHEDIKSQDSSEHKENHIAVPAELRRQGTEPSRRFLMDMNTGMLIHEVGEMNRRVSGFYNPPAYEMRKGTQNSHVTLVDPRTGLMLPSLTEQQRNVAPLDEFRQGTEYQPYILQELRMTEMQKPGNKPSRNLLMDLNTGLLKEHQHKMDRRPGSAKWQVVSGPEHEDIKSHDSSEHKENHIAVPVELRRQGTEPSRRFLMDMNTGMLIHEVGEMNRRVSGFYNPPAYEMRKGTQNSHVTLVDPRTGLMLPSLTEQQRNVAPLDEFRQGTEYQPYILQELRLTEMQKLGNKPSRNLLMDLNTGLLKEDQNKMDRRPGSAKWQVVSGPEHEDIKSQDSSERKENHIAVPVELRRQGTEPSRRFLMDMNTGMLKEEVSEMNRRVSGFYNPPAYEKRQGTEPSRRFLMDMNTGMLLHEVGEMNRRVSGYYNPEAYEMRKGTQNSHATLVDLRAGQILQSVNELQRSTAPLDEFRQGTEYQPYNLQELRMYYMIKPALV
ncbi:hypothetical protein ABG768_000077 [Culter alburnus]|uniref:Uncharacterized protein n=1 Tax=Culter alburnus TaxID=194366 RepID=A0AAW2B3Q1_CULAL